jgi:hypothetical protein
MALSFDRRKRKRVPVHWPVQFVGQARTRQAKATTENLSSEGFYWISRKAFKLGERVECEIAFPAGTIGPQETPVRIQCHVTIKRVERLSRGFGLGCHIEDYKLATGSSALSM